MFCKVMKNYLNKVFCRIKKLCPILIYSTLPCRMPCVRCSIALQSGFLWGSTSMVFLNIRCGLAFQSKPDFLVVYLHECAR